MRAAFSLAQLTGQSTGFAKEFAKKKFQEIAVSNFLAIKDLYWTILDSNQ